jgi:hypothetical protein
LPKPRAPAPRKSGVKMPLANLNTLHYDSAVTT